MILYKALRYIIIDEALNIFFRNLHNNTGIKKSAIKKDGLFPSLNFPDANVYEYIEDNIVKWVAFDRDNFPIGFFPTEKDAVIAWLDSHPEVDPDEDL